MKKIISIALTTVLLSCNLTFFTPFSTTRVDAVSTDISVKLSNYLKNVTQASLEVTDTYYVNNNPATTLTKGTIYTLKLENGLFNLYNGTTKVTSYGASFTLTPSVYNTDHLIKLNNMTYLGSMEFTIESGYIRPINTLPFEDYLKGVVPNEMSASWSEEALKAQTVAARTFSIDDIGKTVPDTQAYQVYGGYALNQYTEKMDRVINATNNQVLKYNGNLISAFYSSSNGGYIESNTGAWGGSSTFFYLQAKQDPYDPVNKFSYTISESNLINAVKSYTSSTIQSITSVTRLSYTEGQRTKTLRFTAKKPDGTTFTFDIAASTVRNLLGASNVKSIYLDAPVKSGTDFIFSGKGYGHGVGMSQYGANEMAKKGYSYQSILAFYYTGATLYGTTTGTEISPPPPPPPADTTAPVISNVQTIVESQNNINVTYKTDEDATTSVILLNSNHTTEATLKTATFEPAGTKTFNWSGKNIVPGAYFVIITSIDAAGNKAISTNPVTLVPLFQSFSIGVIEKTYLYDTPSSLNSVSSIGAQTVTVIDQQDDWYQINTWLGPKWIRPLNVVVDVAKKITLTEKTSMYNNVKDTKSISALGAQTVTTKAQLKGTNWYKISSWLGDKWIYSPYIIEGETQKLSVPLTTFENVSLYDAPFSNAPKASTITPQKVQVVEKWNNWYKIKTWLGEKWIIPTYKIEGTINTISSTLYLSKVTTLHDAPFTEKATTLALSPQPVKATQEWNGWYKINTWLGDKWIRTNI